MILSLEGSMIAESLKKKQWSAEGGSGAWNKCSSEERTEEDGQDSKIMNRKLEKLGG